jgi:hypothetical protein
MGSMSHIIIRLNVYIWFSIFKWMKVNELTGSGNEGDLKLFLLKGDLKT